MAKKTTIKKKTTSRASKKSGSTRPVKKSAPKKSARGAGKKALPDTRRRKKNVASKRPAARKRSPASARRGKLRAADKRAFRNLLLHLRNHISGQIDFLASDNLNRSEHDAELDFRSEEQGTDNYERDLALSRVSIEQNTIFEIDEALHKIQLGTFGACESCDKQIETARLKVMPHTRLCVSCQSEAEMYKQGPRPPDAPLYREADRSETTVEE